MGQVRPRWGWCTLNKRNVIFYFQFQHTNVRYIFVFVLDKKKSFLHLNPACYSEQRMNVGGLVPMSPTAVKKILRTIRNKIAQGDIEKNVLFIILMNFDRYLNGRFWSKALNMHIFMLIVSLSIRIDVLFSNTCNFRF